MQTNEELIENYRKTGNISIRNSIIEKNLPLAYKCVRSFINKYGMDQYYIDDLRSVAVIEMIRCVDSYDPKNSKFSNYAYFSISLILKAYYSRKIAMIRIPIGVYSKMHKMSNDRNHDVVKFNNIKKGTISLDFRIKKYEKEYTLLDNLESNNNTELEYSTNQLNKLLRNIIDNKLTTEQKQVIELHYFDGIPLVKVREKLGLPKHKVQKIISDVLRIVKISLGDKNGLPKMRK